ncbi:hypothetical protein N0V90_012473 [Kalmusia sp. IMI 367209]|nr:hypothetical protein N0V90_012473 [Kalmusia sp. IMI 367209]
MASPTRQHAINPTIDKNEASYVEDLELKEAVNEASNDVVAIYNSYSPEFSTEVEKKLLRLIARLYGLEKDTRVSGAVYNTAIALFSVGYVIMQLPSTVLMTKLRPSIFLPLTMVVWAIVSGATAATHNAAGLLVLRFVLGLVEAPFYPGAVYFLSCWYTKKELGKRMALLICGLLLSNAFAGLISAGILDGMISIGSLASWRWLFILEGIATMIIAFVAMFLLPDYPGTTKWLTEEQRIVAQGRLAKDAGSEETVDEKVSIMTGINWALKDYRTWLFAGLQMSASASISYSHYFPTLVKSLGFTSNTRSLLLTSPPYIFAFFWSLSLASYADKKLVRSSPVMVSMIMCIIGAVLLMALPVVQKWPRYAITFLVAAGSFGVYSTTYTWLSSTIIRPPIKRAAAIGIANSISNTAALFASYFWLDKYSPSFRESWGCSLAFMALGLVITWMLRVSLKRGNRRFEELAAQVDVRDPTALNRLDEESIRAVTKGFRFIT